MVNFRFHLVSLVAVFLALGIGIIVGSTVIDQATVQGLERNVDALEQQRDDARRNRDALRSELARWEELQAELPGEVVAARLADVPVLLVAVEGVERDLVDRAHAWFAAAGAVDQGTVWLGEKLAASEPADRRALAEIVGSSASRSEAVQRAALAALAEALAPPLNPESSAPAETTPTAPVLVPLRDGGFVRFDAPEGSAADLTGLPRPGTRLVVLSGRGARLADADVAVPLTHLLADRVGTSVVAAEGAPDDDGDRGAFVRAIRDDGELRARVSTVDDLDLAYGQLALVLALEDLAGGAVGHYGLAADRLLPSPNR